MIFLISRQINNNRYIITAGMEITYVLSNNSIPLPGWTEKRVDGKEDLTIVIGKDLPTDKYYYRINDGEKKDVAFDKICNVMESVGFKSAQIPEIYHREYYGVYLLFSPFMSKPKRDIFFVELENNIMTLFSNDKYMQNFLKMLHKQKPCSPFVLDWLLTHYSKKNNISINGFNVHVEYQNAANKYNIRYFSSIFSGKKTYKFNYRGTIFDADLGQLNLMYWVLSNEILQYVEQNLRDIEVDFINYGLEKY